MGLAFRRFLLDREDALYGVGLICVPGVPVETQCFSRAPRMPSSQVIDCG
jgi:hypothetical protein